MVFEKVRRARIEVRRLYDPVNWLIFGIAFLFGVWAAVSGEWGASIVLGWFTIVVLRATVRNNHRWRAVNEPE
jgi:tetrahydromethanopterin S-methyltransferase subunit E